jgi:transcriptional regulator with XRE-family HTH domain
VNKADRIARDADPVAMKKLNLIRRQVRKLRERNGWTQEDFAVKLQLAGWHNATRSTVSKIEGGSLGVAEYDLLFIAAALRVHFIHLFPEIDWKRPMDETVHQHIPQELHDFTPESEPS